MSPPFDVRSMRGSRNAVDPRRPYAMHVEPEYSAAGRLEDVATVFLTNRECPFPCVMCDLWKNTTEETVPVGAIPAQIGLALNSLPPASHVKLYNSGNFFDPNAIPSEDHSAIAELVKGFETVIVENHPKLCDARVPAFQDLCGTQLEVAIGLETSHEPTLSRLNKQMSTSDFAAACRFLLSHGIRIRTFILLRPPWTTEREGIDRAIESARFAFDCGVDCCAVIPTRDGNGVMDQLRSESAFHPPALQSLERVIDEVVSWSHGRVFADLWDIEKCSECSRCLTERVERLRLTNNSQVVQPAISCPLCGGNDNVV